MEGKTNFSRRLKQFDGLTWLILRYFATDLRHYLLTFRLLYAFTGNSFKPLFLSRAFFGLKFRPYAEARKLVVGLFEKISSNIDRLNEINEIIIHEGNMKLSTRAWQ